MVSKRIILTLGIFLIFSSIIGAYASDYQDISRVLEENDESELTGCCSIVLQLDGNNSMMSFRRDANLTAEIYIEEIDWHGMKAIKQYKTEGGYFCQVIITSNGWMIGYGGIDDGEDNQKIEEITAGMISDDYSISESSLSEIQQIKQQYKMGHVVIKAPNGNYGLTTATDQYTGKLEPGQYLSVPNRYTYFRSGSIPLNTTDDEKIKDMIELEITDMFGLTRRDITTFNFHPVDNSTFTGNVTDIYLSNDDGSTFGMSTASLADNVHFQNKVFNAEEIPIAPNYQSIGSVMFANEQPESSNFILFAYAALVAFIGLLFFVTLKIIMSIRSRKYR